MIENPAGSLLWEFGSFKRPVRKYGTRPYPLDMCRFGVGAPDGGLCRNRWKRNQEFRRVLE